MAVLDCTLVSELSVLERVTVEKEPRLLVVTETDPMDELSDVAMVPGTLDVGVGTDDSEVKIYEPVNDDNCVTEVRISLNEVVLVKKWGSFENSMSGASGRLTRIAA